jgi:hypothetical protein
MKDENQKCGDGNASQALPTVSEIVFDEKTGTITLKLSEKRKEDNEKSPAEKAGGDS